MAYWYKCQCLFVYLIIIIQYTTGSTDTGINLTLLIFSSDSTFLSLFLYRYPNGFMARPCSYTYGGYLYLCFLLLCSYSGPQHLSGV